MVTAIVLAAGANLGAAQVGMLEALWEHGVQPDLVVGTSVGALNGAWLAGQAPLGGLAALWRSPQRYLPRGPGPRAPGVCRPAPAPGRRQGDPPPAARPPPLRACTGGTDPVLPPVRIDGRWLMDGGVVNNTPISHAVDLGADTVWVLTAGYVRFRSLHARRWAWPCTPRRWRSNSA